MSVGAIDSAVPLSIWPHMPSGPDALVVSICFRYQVNSSVVHSVSSSRWWEVAGENVEMFMIERASTSELKLCSRTSRRQALSCAVETMIPEEFFSVGMWDVSDF